MKTGVRCPRGLFWPPASIVDRKAFALDFAVVLAALAGAFT